MTIGDKVLQTAISQLGTMEAPAGSNNVMYNTWYYGREVSGAAYPWCMAFVQWCCAEAGYPLPYKTASCSALLNWYRANEPGRIVNTPEKGDIVIYGFGHTGIVESAGDGTVTAIEGNTSMTSDDNGGKVMQRIRPASTVVAYIRPFREPEEVTDVDKRYDYIEDMPEYYREEALKLIERGALRGKDGGKLDLSEDMLRCLIICQRMIDGK